MSLNDTNLAVQINSNQESISSTIDGQVLGAALPVTCCENRQEASLAVIKLLETT